jgi:hypothetical protein
MFVSWSAGTADVTAPSFAGGETRIRVRAIDPTQNSGGITSTASPAVLDGVTLVRQRQPARF